MLFRQIYDTSLAQYAYLVGCQRTGEALVIDPQRDIDRYLELAAAEEVRITAVTETHIHADFLSGARQLAARHGATAYLSAEGGADWSYAWPAGEGQQVRLLRHGDRFAVGNIEIEAVHTPGHTPEHLSFLVTDRGGGAAEPMGLASGDFVFVGDLGRPDLLETAAGQVGAMEPAARRLCRSARSFLELPDYLQVWPGHGAGSACGKALGAVPGSTVGYEKRYNAALRAAGDESLFVASILEGQPEPPLYFGRMKRQNRAGAPLYGELPRPPRLGAARLHGTDGVVLDTRCDRAAFMAAHLPGSLYTPLDRSFPTTAGCYVEADTPIVLIVEPEGLDEAVRGLIRIGLDDIVGWAAPQDLAALAGELAAIERLDFAAVRGERPAPWLLDVRRRSEFDLAHLPGASNVAHTRLSEHLGELPRDRRLAVHCATGARAAAASALLAARGFRVAYVDDDFSNAAAGGS